MILQIYISFTQICIYIFHFLLQMPVDLVVNAKRMLYSEHPTVLLKHLNTMFLTNFENLHSISNIFQETHNFLVLTSPVIICIYLRTTDRHFLDEGTCVIPPQSY